MKIYTVRVPKPDLMAMPVNERQFFLLAGHFFNELMILSKLMIMTQETPNEKVSKRIGVTHAMFVNKMMAGKLYEGWILLKNTYFNTSLSKMYHSKLEKKEKRR